MQESSSRPKRFLPNAQAVASKDKKRLDLLLVERGLAPTREKAQALILSGQVLVEDHPATKAGQAYPLESEIRIRGEALPFVSRGGLKLSAALKDFKITAAGKVCLDIGASTGGFTDVLLQDGAEKVFAVDVGHNQMDWKIRQDDRVVCIEKTNARSMTFETVGRSVELIVVDVSFISLEKIVPNLIQFATDKTDWITLIKPQFEVGREKVGKGGIVRSHEDRNEVIERLKTSFETLGLHCCGLIESPITGTEGNIEYLACWRMA